MKAIVEKLKILNWYDYLLIPLFLLYFRQGIFSLWITFTSKEFYENGIAFILVLTIFVFTIFRNKDNISSGNKVTPFLLLILVLILNTLNAIFFRFSIVPAILFLLGTYCLLGFYLESRFWRRSIFIFLILILTLPLLERVQKFLGFPIRLVTANIVSYILQLFGIGNVSNSAVIVTENHATSIDLPCSGVKSIYTGALFMLAVYYLQKVRVSFSLLVITTLFFAALLFFNTWRVFSLVYIYDVLDMKTFGNTIHVSLGVVGFLVSCSLLWIATNRFASNSKVSNKRDKNINKKPSIPTKQIILIVLSFLIVTNWFLVKEQPTGFSHTLQTERSFELETVKLSELPFTDREQSYFVNSDVEFSKKFTGVTGNGQPFSLLIVSSKSARTHHDPEICLQGLGYEIDNSEILQAKDFRLRKLSLNGNKDEVLYWYVGRNKNLLDYSERVWEEVTNPQQTWVLVIVGFTSIVDIEKPSISSLILQVNSEAKQLLD